MLTYVITTAIIQCVMSGWLFYLTVENHRNVDALKAQQENLDRVNRDMAEHTHMVQVAGGPTPTHAPHYQERP